MDMKSFLEAAVRTEDSERAVEIIRSRVARQTGQEIYVTKVMDIVIGGDGIKRYGIFMMFADGHHALRLNWKSYDTSASVESISFWVHLSKDPQFEASTKGMNIVQIINLIDDVVAGVDTEQEQVAESILLEAATIGFSNVKALFSKAGYIIDKDPAFTVRRWLVTNRKTGESIPIRYTPTVGEMYNEIRTLGVEGFIDKTRADGSRKVPAESGKIKPAAKEQAIPMQRSPFDSLFEDPLSEKELFGLLSKGVSDVKSGKSKTLIVCGDPGLGKTFEVTRQLVGTNSESFKGGLTSASALYKMLFINNEKGKILIFDDLDVLLEDKECVNILKGALESSANPEVSYISNNTIHPIYYKALTGEYDLEDPKVIESLNALKIDIVNMNEKRLEVMKMRAMDPYSAAAILPNKFAFVAKVIFISNKYLDEIPGALLSRGGTKIEINLTLEEIVKRIEGLLPKLEVPVEAGTPGISMKEKQAAMDYCKKVLIPYGKIKKIDFRSFFDICRLASGDAPKELWHKWASVMLMETYGDRDTSIKRKKR